MTDRTLIDAFPAWMSGGGIFIKIQDWAPWRDDPNILPIALDIAYFGNHSGNKIQSPMIDKMSGNADGNYQLSAVNIERINNILRTLYHNTWSALWRAVTTEYDPLNNYDMSETTERATNRDDTRNRTNEEKTTTDIKTETAKEDVSKKATKIKTTHAAETETTTATDIKSEDNTNTTSTHGVTPMGATGNVVLSTDTQSGDKANNTSRTYGDAASNKTIIKNNPLSNYEEQSGSADDNTQTATQDPTKNYNRTIGEGDKNKRENTETETGTGRETETQTLVRKGNIGVTTSQQMLESSYELAKRKYFDRVFEDLDSILTISYYKGR